MIPPEELMELVEEKLPDYKGQDLLTAFQDFVTVFDAFRLKYADYFVQWFTEIEQEAPEDEALLLELTSNMVLVGYYKDNNYFTKEGVLINAPIKRYLII